MQIDRQKYRSTDGTLNLPDVREDFPVLGDILIRLRDCLGITIYASFF